jgi:hypothetical protein
MNRALQRGFSDEIDHKSDLLLHRRFVSKMVLSDFLKPLGKFSLVLHWIRNFAAGQRFVATMKPAAVAFGRRKQSAQWTQID